MGIVPTSIGIHSKYYTSSNIAMDGYDLTIYHIQKKANKGDVRFNYKYDDTNWFFTNSKNQKLFSSRPHKYLPQFGGYCTYMISKGYTYPPDMKVWHIDKINYNAFWHF
jgi:YHS domain-containing protein